VPSTLADLGRHQFVSLTTFRRSGQPVPTPVWIAPDGDALVVTTPADSGKVKRLRHDPRVELRPCTRSGKVAPDAPTVAAVARVVPTDHRSTTALKEKYRLQYRLIALLERVVRRGRVDRVILRITSA
jgi:hypothetical protein